MKKNLFFAVICALLLVCSCQKLADITKSEHWKADITIYYLKNGTKQIISHYEVWEGESECYWADDSTELERLNAESDSVREGMYDMKIPQKYISSIDEIVEDYFLNGKDLPCGMTIEEQGAEE